MTELVCKDAPCDKVTVVSPPGTKLDCVVGWGFGTDELLGSLSRKQRIDEEMIAYFSEPKL
jgi:hypothetical protein